MTAEGYEVLRMIEHNQSCYVSSEYIHGEPLIRWLKYHPNLSKKRLYALIQKMTRRLGQFHRCKGNPSYKYVNPYSMIIAEDGELYFLDLKAESNKGELHKMHRRAVRDSFLPPKASYYQQASEELDIYGLGRTMQYVLAVSEPEPRLTKREEHKLQKIISRCLNRQSKKAYQKIPDILKAIPTCKKETEVKVRTKPEGAEENEVNRAALFKIMKISVGFLTVIVLITGVLIYRNASGNTKYSDDHSDESKLEETADSSSDIESTKRINRKEEGEKTAKSKKMSEAASLQFEMGMLHLLETRDYEKAGEYFQKSEGQLSKSFSVIAEEFAGGDGSQDKIKLRQALMQAEKNMDTQSVTDKVRAGCLRSLVKGYSMLDTKEDAAQVIRLGKEFLTTAEKEGELKEEPKKENSEYMAAAYEEMGETEESIKMYEELLAQEGEREKREELYRKLATLWDQTGKQDMAWECCRQGIEEYEDSAAIWLLYIQMQLKDTAVDREVCAATIQECIKKLPEITQQEEYKKLQREYEIRMEGEKVCVGK